jgi:hypothetical protein
MRRPRPLDPSAHLRHSWRVHALARSEGFGLHDVWEVDARLPTGATLADWAEAVRRERAGPATRLLFAVRVGVGRLLGLDRGSARFVPVYAEAEEQLHRIDNRTVSAYLHLSLVDRRPRMAVYVRPRGGLGRCYMRLIDPFRHAIVYPGLLAAGRRAARRLEG